MNMYPTLVVGIGGSGKLVCKFLKKYFAEKFPKEWVKPATGLPPIVSILVIETQPGKEKEELALPELPDVPTITAYVDEPTIKAMQEKEFLEKNPEIGCWLHTPLPIKEIIGGAGQIRQAGRLAFFRHRKAYGSIQTAITTEIDNIKSEKAVSLTRQLSEGRINVPHSTPRCYIISSVCGGTGSGMLLDIAGIVNKAGARANLIAFLPKMFEPVIDLSESVWQLYSNTYATLKEIHHYMTSGKWQVWYDIRGKDGVSLDKKIFEYCFLVEKESDTLDLRSRLHVAPLVGEFLFWMISELEHSLHTSGVNIRQFIEANTENWCNGLGIASVSFPLEEIKNIMVNWGIRELITEYLSVKFKDDEIDKKVMDPNTGYLYSDFYYKNWEEALLKKKEYITLAVDTFVKRKGKLEVMLKGEKERLRREYEADVRRIGTNFSEYVDKIKNRFVNLTDELLTTKGPKYLRNFIEKFKVELNNVRTRVEDEQHRFQTRISELDKTIEESLKLLGRIRKKKWFMDIGWWKRIEPHVRSILKMIKEFFDTSLMVEKHKYALKIIETLNELIDTRKGELDALYSKLRGIRLSKEKEEDRLWSILMFASEAQIKVKANRENVESFYDEHLKGELDDIGTDLRKRLIEWQKMSEEEITKEIESTIKGRLSKTGFDNLTIMDAMKDKMEELGSIVQDCITNRSSPLIRHTGKRPFEDKFLISGLEEQDIRGLSAIPEGATLIKSDIESDKRRIIFIRLSSNFSLGDLAAYDFADKYAKAYRDSIDKNHKWIHTQKEAIGFEDPLGLAIGIEAEPLIRTCQDVGIVYEKGSHHFVYREYDKEVTIAQGLENAIGKLEDDPRLADNLKRKLLEFFNNQTVEWIVDYLNDHDSTRFASESEFRRNHENKYKNAFSTFAYPIPPHRIPSYVLDELKKRISRS